MCRYLSLLLLIGLAWGQTNAITSDGKKVILKNDGTWKYSEEKKQIDPKNSIWKTRYYVDDFGDFTDSGYITTNVVGTFSNSATTNSELGVRFIVDNVVCIKLYEYNQDHSVNGKIINKDYTVLIKQNGEKLLPLFANNISDRLEFDYKNSKKLIAILKLGGTIAFRINQQGKSSSSYSFKIEDERGFDSVYNKLFGKKKITKNKKSSERKIIFEDSSFEVSYVTHKEKNSVEIEMILVNLRKQFYRSVWFNLVILNDKKVIKEQRIKFISVMPLEESKEYIYFDKNFNDVKVEFLKIN